MKREVPLTWKFVPLVHWWACYSSILTSLNHWPIVEKHLGCHGNWLQRSTHTQRMDWWPAILQEIKAWAHDYEVQNMIPAKSNKPTADELVPLLLFSIPKLLKGAVSNLVGVLMGTVWEKQWCACVRSTSNESCSDVTATLPRPKTMFNLLAQSLRLSASFSVTSLLHDLISWASARFPTGQTPPQLNVTTPNHT